MLYYNIICTYNDIPRFNISILSADNVGVKRIRSLLSNVDPDTTFKVPEFFTLEFADLTIQKQSTYYYSAPYEHPSPLLLQHEQSTKNQLSQEREWLQAVANIVVSGQTPENLALTNLVYHSRQDGAVQPHEHLTISALLPVQFEPAHTLEMMRHCIDLITAAKNVVNPSQKTTFDVSDEPLYALSKQVQFSFPQQYNLALYLPLMGDLHTEQASFLIHITVIVLTATCTRFRPRLI